MGNCWDNVVAESFSQTLEVVALSDAPLANRQHIRALVYSHAEAHWYRQRLHASSGFMTPKAFKMQAAVQCRFPSFGGKISGRRRALFEAQASAPCQGASEQVSALALLRCAPAAALDALAMEPPRPAASALLASSTTSGAAVETCSEVPWSMPVPDCDASSARGHRRGTGLP